MAIGLYAFSQAIHDGKDTKCDTMETPRRRFGVAGGRKRKFLRRFVLADRRGGKQGTGGKDGDMGGGVKKWGDLRVIACFAEKEWGCSGNTTGFFGGKNGTFQWRERIFAGWKRGAAGGLKC